MKNVVVAMDSFKGSLSTFQAENAVKDGIKKVFENVCITTIPVADGGEGTVESIVSAVNGSFEEIEACNPLGRKIKAKYGIVQKTKTAIIEMSATAGITLIKPEERNPLNTTTYGVGELIVDAISKGCRNFIIGIGGSATNDGGVGMLQALGFEFLDKDGNQIQLGAKGLEKIFEIKTDNALKELKDCKFEVACDVKNVLCGEKGCSVVYGPQKGATHEMVKDMDLWLKNYGELTKKVIPHADENAYGTGAAGGMGFALMSYLNASLQSGIDLVIRETELEKYIEKADLVVTGEGRLDGQTNMGKAPVGIAKTAKKYNKPVIAFSGCVTDDAKMCNECGIDAFFPILKAPCSLETAMDSKNAYNNLRDTAEQVFRLLKSRI